MARPLGGTGPGRPAEEGGQSSQIVAVVDRVRPQAVLGGGIGKEAGVVADQPPVSLRLLARELEHARALVVAVGAEVLDCLARRGVRALAAEAALDVVRRPAQIVGGVVRPELGAVAVDRAVLHQPVVQKDLLASLDIALGVEQPT